MGIVQLHGSMAGGVTPWVEDEFTPTSGQVSFILSQAPVDFQTLTVAVNGVLADGGVHFVVSGTTLTWLDAAYTLEPTDHFVVRYR